MNNPSSIGWRRLATDALEAARKLTADHPRSVINRVYYSMFAETHARLIEQGVRPRQNLGTWKHAEIPLLARKYLVKPLGKEGARTWSQTLRKARTLREYADYRPTWEIDSPMALALLNEASKLLGESR